MIYFLSSFGWKLRLFDQEVMAAASVDAPMLEEAEENKIKVITEVYRPLLIKVLDVRDFVEALKIQFGGDDGKILFL